MRLPAYDIKMTLSDPNGDTEFSITLQSVPREKILTTPFPLKGALEAFEEAVEDGGEGVPISTSFGGRK